MSNKRNVLLGIFVGGGVLLFAFGLFLIGSRKQIFSHHFTVYTYMASMQTLQSGATVRVAGMDGGRVKGIDIPKNPSQKFRLALEVDEKFHPIVRDDSVATIETNGMVGDKYVNIAQGSDNSPEVKPGGTLPSKEGGGMDALMQKGNQIADDVQATIKDVHKNANETLQSFTATAQHVDGMIVAARGHVEQTIANVDHITSGIRQGRGTVGKLLSDSKMAADVQTTIENAKQTSANIQTASNNVNSMITDFQRRDMPDLDAVIKNARDMSAQLDQATGTFLSQGANNEPTAVALRTTVDNAQQAVTNVSDDTEALKHNFFLRGFFKRRGYYNLSDLTPEKYARTKFVRKPHIREWLPGDQLFKTDSKGQQTLTEGGKSVVDESMSALVEFLPNNPMVVEGYASGGTLEQEYLASRQRAEEVCEYLKSRYHVKQNLLGIMPLENHPPAGTGKETWDGIALALVLSK